jgi:hypothetical protein
MIEPKICYGYIDRYENKYTPQFQPRYALFCCELDPRNLPL